MRANIPDLDKLLAEKGGHINAAAYCRVSTDSEEQLTSFKNQQAYFSELFEGNNSVTLIKVYADEGLSGTTLNKRAAFQEMLESAYSGEIDLIVMKEVSRFARNTADFHTIINKLRNSRVAVAFLNTSYNTLYMSAGDIAALSIASVIAEMESRNTSERVKWGQRQQMAKGVVFGRREMLGYRIDGTEMTIVPEEADVVRLIFSMFVNEGNGTSVIANKLHDMGIPSFRHKRWTNTVILRVLRNEKYVGDLCQQKTFTPDCLSHAKKYNRGQVEKVYIRDHHEPIIDRKTWDLAQAELARRSPSEEEKKKYSNRYWCSGKLTCGECGATFVNRKHTKARAEKAKGDYLAWRCGEAAQHGARKQLPTGEWQGCCAPSVNNKVLLAAVGFVMKLLQQDNKALIDSLRKELAAVFKESDTVKSVDYTAKIEEVEGLKRKAVDLCLKGIITENELSDQKAYYDRQISEYRQKQAAVKKQEQMVREYEGRLNDCIKAVKTMLDYDSPDDTVCGRLLERIVVYKDNRLSVKLNNLPYTFDLRYQTSGKLDKFRVDFTLAESGIHIEQFS